MADDTSPTLSNADAQSQAEYEFDAARLQLARTEIDAIAAESRLTAEAREMNMATLDATVHVIQHGGTEVPAANEGEHLLVEAVRDADAELDTRMDDIRHEASELEVRFDELKAKPPEERDHEEMQDVANQMTELATRAHESNTEFALRAGELSPLMAEVTADVVAHDPGEGHVLVTESAHATGGWFVAVHDSAEAEQTHVEHDHATESNGFDGSANAGE